MPVFRGVPFATADRFRPPQVLPPNALPARDGPFGPPAAQLPDPLDRIWGERLAPGSEDCLSLNVWTPDVNAKRPVLLWLHGGAFVIGSSKWGQFDGSTLAAEQNVVVVTANYRLGAFGYLDLSEFGAEYAESGNLGTLDQIAALEWVKANIHHFGGDSENVTLGGQSAGGISVACLMGCERAKGLFQRAIVMSGPPSLFRSKAFAQKITARFVRAAGVSGVDDLLKLSMMDMLRAQRQTLREADFVGEQAFGPTVGGTLLPLPPLHAIRAGTAAGVPLLCGSTADEMRLWTLYNPIMWKLSFGAIAAWLKRMGFSPRAMKATYHRATPHQKYPTLAVLGDFTFWMPQVRLAEAQSTHAPTWEYLLAWQSTADGGRLGAPHASDIPLLFGTTAAPGASHLVGDPAHADAVARQVRAHWGAFVRTGTPAGGEWPKFDTTSRTAMVLNTTSETKNDPLREVREAWSRLPFDGVTPGPQDLPRMSDVRNYALTRAAVVLAVVLLLVVALVWLLWK